MRSPAINWAIARLHQNNNAESLLRTLAGVAFRDRAFSRQGEFHQRFVFRPSEYPSLLLGAAYFETTALREYRSLLVPGDCIFDVGANIGLTAQRFDGILEGRCSIWAFEPCPRNAELLRQNVKYMGNRITVVGKAVGDTQGSIDFLDNLGHGGLSQIADFQGKGAMSGQLWKRSMTISVELTTLDAVVKADRNAAPSFIKIDVEGAGGLVLRGAAATIRDNKPVISCSFHSTEEQNMVCEALAPIGYRGLAISPDRTCRWTELRESDGTFVHPQDPRVSRLTFQTPTIQ